MTTDSLVVVVLLACLAACVGVDALRRARGSIVMLAMLSALAGAGAMVAIVVAPLATANPVTLGLGVGAVVAAMAAVVGGVVVTDRAVRNTPTAAAAPAPSPTDAVPMPADTATTPAPATDSTAP